MVGLACSDARIVLAAKNLDADPHLLNAPNGTIDLRTGELRPHRRSDLLTHRVAVPFDPEETAPTWKSFLADVLPNDGLRAYVQRMTGQAAVGENTDEVFHVLVGSGANGKTKFAETITTALGDYAATRSAELFLDERRGSTARPELVTLRRPPACGLRD
jgi:putative DNA primase/helicase